MAFKKGTRKFYMRASGERCQHVFYGEENGWEKCPDPAEHLHHIRPQGETLANGGNPEDNIGMPLCARHHVRNESWEPHDINGSRHPDVGNAYKRYGQWKSQEQHINSITGRRSVDYSTSPFADVSREHKKKIAKGERYMSLKNVFFVIQD